MGPKVDDRVDRWERTIREINEVPEQHRSHVLVVHSRGARSEVLVFREAEEARDLLEHLAAIGYDARLEPHLVTQR